jgi:hypothetical protein
MKACSVLGSESLTRCLGMPPRGEIAIPHAQKIHLWRSVSTISNRQSGSSFPQNACAATAMSDCRTSIPHSSGRAGRSAARLGPRQRAHAAEASSSSGSISCRSPSSSRFAATARLQDDSGGRFLRARRGKGRMPSDVRKKDRSDREHCESSILSRTKVYCPAQATG